MPTVDFYLIPETAITASYSFLCKLIEKAYLQTRLVYLHCNSAEEAAVLDDLLWVFRDISFIPHELVNSKNSLAPIKLGYGQLTQPQGDILVNLTTEVPQFFAGYKRVIEIVPNNANDKKICREKFRHYRENNCELTTHDLTKKVE